MPRLTKQLIDETPFPAAGQVFVRDIELSGFALRVTKGRKSFILEKRIRGRMRRLTLGPYGPLTLDHARKLAAMHVEAIAQGADPAQVRQDRLHEPTFGDLTAQYLERHAPRKRSARDDQGMLTTHLAIFRMGKLTDLNRNDVALLRKMFNLARDWALYAGDNPATRIQFFREESRDRFVQPEELPRLFQAIAEEADPSVRAVVLTALLTGARRTEVLTMQWNDVSLTRPSRVADPIHQGRAPASLARAPRTGRHAPKPPQGGGEPLCVSWAALVDVGHFRFRHSRDGTGRGSTHNSFCLSRAFFSRPSGIVSPRYLTNL